MIVQSLFPDRVISKNNTDYSYGSDLERMCAKMEMSFRYCDDWRFCAKNNTSHVLNALIGRMPVIRRAAYWDSWKIFRRLIDLPQDYAKDADLLYSNFLVPSQKFGKPFILEADFTGYGALNRQRRKMAQLLKLPRNVVDSCDAIVVRTEKSKSDFNELYPDYAGHLAVIPFYMDYIEPISESSLSQKLSSLRPLEVIFVGNQAKRKGLVLLIKAINNLREQGFSVELTVVSNFMDGEVSIPEWAKHYRGAQRGEVVQLMRSAHVFAMPTLSDAYPKVCYEAIASGCATLLPNWSPLADMWHNTGVLVDVFNANSISEGLLKLNSEKIATQVRSNLSLYNKDFSSDSIRSLYSSLFKKVIENESD